MDHEYEADLLTLLDDEGQEHEFEIIDELENDDAISWRWFPPSRSRTKSPLTRRPIIFSKSSKRMARSSSRKWMTTPCWISWPPFSRSGLTRPISTARRNNPPPGGYPGKGAAGLFPTFR